MPVGYGTPPGYGLPSTGRVAARTRTELGALYATSIAYGIGVGAWLGIELEIEDPGIFLIAPTVLGAAAPVGVALLDRPAMPEGLPGAIAGGLVMGAGEGLGLAGVHDTTVAEGRRWGIRGFSRATTVGATLGGVGGGLVGYYLEPPPETVFFATSSIFWGTAIGSFFGYGASPADEGWSRSNDSAALGGFVGFNVALVGAAGLGALWIPSWEQLGWMWAGAGIGAGASLPVFLLYAGEGGPPAKRGFLFTGTATTLGLTLGALLSPGSDAFGVAGHGPGAASGGWVCVTHVAPMAVQGGGGVVVGGLLR